jgi:CPA2 family monovalent cation:H+ antiporter-2
MQDLNLLRDLVILVAIAIPVVAAAQRLRIPSIVGFLATGVVIGPFALGWIHEVESVRQLAEIGVVLLLFAIGLELSLARVIAIGPLILQGGAIQVVGTLGVVTAVAFLFDVPFETALVLGALAALSSTAIVLKVLKDRDALDSTHGRVVVAILLFQDLAIVPLILLVRILGGADEPVGMLVQEVAVSLGVVAAMVVGGRFAVPWVLERLVNLDNREIFTLGIMFLGLGAAFVTASFGLSLALGAFLAGLVISESEFGFQALSDVLPFRDTFSGIFFISVGMLLDVGAVIADPAPYLLAAVAIVAIKTVVGAGATLTLRRPFQVSIMAGMALSQVGEFSFVLATVARPFELLTPALDQLFLGSAVLTMLITPFTIAGARPVSAAICKVLRKPFAATPAESTDDAAELKDHVIVVGYGVNGRNLARVLDGAGIPYVVLEQNGQVVRRARQDLQPILFGDATQVHMLERVGVKRARAIVFAISSLSDEMRGVAVVRRLNPHIRILVRTRYVRAVDDLEHVGADDVIAEEFETSLEIFSRVLRHYDVPSNVIVREVQAARSEQYGIVRGRVTGEFRLDALIDLGIHHALDIIQVEHGAKAVGEHPTTLHLRRETGATVIAVVRHGVAHYAPEPDFRFVAGDAVVLVGDADALERGREVFVPSA